MALWALSQVPATLIELALGMEVHRQALGLTAGLVVAAAGTLLLLEGLWGAVVLHVVAIGACLRWPEHEMAVVPAFVVLNLAVIVHALRRRAREQAGEADGGSAPSARE